jgi:hypothetical protein
LIIYLIIDCYEYWFMLKSRLKFNASIADIYYLAIFMLFTNSYYSYLCFDSSISLISEP